MSHDGTVFGHILRGYLHFFLLALVRPVVVRGWNAAAWHFLFVIDSAHSQVLLSEELAWHFLFVIDSAHSQVLLSEELLLLTAGRKCLGKNRMAR
jgi:hypothetical protein